MSLLRYPSVALQLLAEYPDADLLGRYVLDRADDAFAQLVMRYSRLVWGQCRNLLPAEADAEDAFQATFLVLARSAESLPAGVPLGPWLHGVAFKVCKNAQGAFVRRSNREKACSQPEGGRPVADSAWEKAFATVAREVQKLPEAQRTAFVLCYIQGRSAAEAATALGLTVGTVATRLSRAKETLLSRLAKHDLGAGALVLCAVTVVGSSAPAALIQSTLATVSAGAPWPGSIPILLHGATEMTLRFKLLAVGLLVATGLGLGAYLVLDTKSPADVPSAKFVAPAPLEGEWRCVGMQRDGKKRAIWAQRQLPRSIVFRGDVVTFKPWYSEDGTFTLSPDHAIDVVARSEGRDKARVVLGIYSVAGDRLRICIENGFPETPRPDGFTTGDGGNRYLFDFVKVPAGTTLQETATDRMRAILSEEDSQELTGKKELKPTEREQLAARCIAIHVDFPGTEEATAGLFWVITNAPDGKAGKAALSILKGGHIAGAELAALENCVGQKRGNIGHGQLSGEIEYELAPILMERVRRTPDDPAGAGILSAICCTYKGDTDIEAPPVFAAAAAMIAERWTKSPEISHFLETFILSSRRPWLQQYEPTVRRILAESPDEYVRLHAGFALAKIVSEAGESRQDEAQKLFADYVARYEFGQEKTRWSSIAESYVAQSKAEMEGIKVRRIGGPAPVVKGVDLDGKPMELADYKGKVVLVSFWATWCGPCMRLIPHERKLVEQLKGRPFALVGVNGDKIKDFDQKVIAKNAISWRSFQDIRPDQTPISDEWKVGGWPTLFLIDHTGTIRRRWEGAPPNDELDQEVARWVKAAEGKK